MLHNIFLCAPAQAAGGHAASYSALLESLFKAVKRPRRETDHSPPLVPTSRARGVSFSRQTTLTLLMYVHTRNDVAHLPKTCEINLQFGLPFKEFFNFVNQGCTRPRRQVAVITKFCTCHLIPVAPHCGACSMSSLRHERIFRCLLDFRQICAPLLYMK